MAPEWYNEAVADMPEELDVDGDPMVLDMGYEDPDDD